MQLGMMKVKRTYFVPVTIVTSSRSPSPVHLESHQCRSAGTSTQRFLSLGGLGLHAGVGADLWGEAGAAPHQTQPVPAAERHPWDNTFNEKAKQCVEWGKQREQQPCEHPGQSRGDPVVDNSWRNHGRWGEPHTEQVSWQKLLFRVF